MVSICVSYAPQLPLELPFSPLLAGVQYGSPCTYRLERRKSTETASNSKAVRLSQALFSEFKPLPAIAAYSARTSSHSPIVNLLDLLDRMDNDVSCEVQRVRENIRETRALVKEVKIEQRLRSSDFLARRDQESRETKGVLDDFWLGV